jgi:enoyl-CoA hydratase
MLLAYEKGVALAREAAPALMKEHRTLLTSFLQPPQKWAIAQVACYNGPMTSQELMTFGDPSVIEVEPRGQIAVLWLARESKRNALGPAFWRQLPLAMEHLSRVPSIRCVVIAPRGKDFSVGLDLTAVDVTGGTQPSILPGPAESSAEALAPSTASRARATFQEVQRLQASIDSVATCPKPVLAAIWGWCLGGGLDLAAACDIRIASEDAKLGIRETRVAMVADLGSLQRLPRIIGEGHVAELAFTGRDIDASTAKEMGLVNSVEADADAALHSALEMAEVIATNSPLAVQGAKAVLMEARQDEIRKGLAHVALWNSAFLDSNDLQEALSAFLEKRPPRFTGT